MPYLNPNYADQFASIARQEDYRYSSLNGHVINKLCTDIYNAFAEHCNDDGERDALNQEIQDIVDRHPGAIAKGANFNTFGVASDASKLGHEMRVFIEQKNTQFGLSPSPAPGV